MFSRRPLSICVVLLGVGLGTACRPAELLSLPLPPSCTEVAPAACGDGCDVVMRQVGDVDDANIRVLFVADGYGPDEGGDFFDDVASLWQAVGAHEDGIVGRSPALFRARAAFPMVPAEAPGSAFAGCFQTDALDGTTMLAVDLGAVDDVTAANDAAADVVVVIVNAVGRANAPYGAMTTESVSTATETTVVVRTTARKVVLSRTNGADVLEHELGHAVVGLGDEYADVDACREDTDVFAGLVVSRNLPAADLDAPNLTLDPTGARWADIVDGAEEGGQRYGSCIYHPPHGDGGCRMEHSSSSAWCPVCDAAITDALSVRAGLTVFDSTVCQIGAGPGFVLAQVHGPDAPYRIDVDVVGLVAVGDARTRQFVASASAPSGTRAQAVCTGAHGRVTHSGFVSVP
jgi:hypothetical protein